MTFEGFQTLPLGGLQDGRARFLNGNLSDPCHAMLIFFIILLISNNNIFCFPLLLIPLFSCIHLLLFKYFRCVSCCAWTGVTFLFTTCTCTTWSQCIFNHLQTQTHSQCTFTCTFTVIWLAVPRWLKRKLGRLITHGSVPRACSLVCFWALGKKKKKTA